jgi:hypothetical protein
MKMDLQVVFLGMGHGLDWDKWPTLVNAVMKLRVP